MKDVFPGISSEWSALPEPVRVIAAATVNSIITCHPCFIIGPSGVGKSTAVSAVLRHYLGDAKERTDVGLQDNGLFEITFHPGSSPMTITGGPDLPALVRGVYTVTKEGSMMDPRVRAVLIDEMPLGSPQALDALLRVADMPGRPIIATGNTQVPIGSIGRSYWDALLDRFGMCHVPPHRVQASTGYDMVSVALNAASERFRAMDQGDTPRRGVEIDIGRFRLPRFDEMRAFQLSVLRANQVSVHPRVRSAVNDLMRAVSAGEFFGSDQFRMTPNQRNLTSVSRALVSVALFEQWRSFNKTSWQAIYDEPDAVRRATWWEEYIHEAAHDPSWTKIERISTWNAQNIAVVLPTMNHKMAMWAVNVVFKTLNPIISISAAHHEALKLLESVHRIDLAAYTALTTHIGSLTMSAQGNSASPGKDDPEMRELSLFAKAMRVVMIERAALDESGPNDNPKRFYEDIRAFMAHDAARFGISIDGHRPLHTLALKLRLDEWPPSGQERDIIVALARADDELMSRHSAGWRSSAQGRRTP